MAVQMKQSTTLLAAALFWLKGNISRDMTRLNSLAIIPDGWL